LSFHGSDTGTRKGRVGSGSRESQSGLPGTGATTEEAEEGEEIKRKNGRREPVNLRLGVQWGAELPVEKEGGVPGGEGFSTRVVESAIQGILSSLCAQDLVKVRTIMHFSVTANRKAAVEL